MLGEAELRTVEALAEPRSVTALHEATGYNKGYVSQVVQGLERDGIVASRRTGHAKEVRALPTTVVETYRGLRAAHPHVDFPAVLSPSVLRVCWFLDEPVRVSAIEPHLSLHRTRIYQILRDLQAAGLVTKADHRYELREEFADLADFADAVVVHEHRNRARRLVPEATVVWAAPEEALVTFAGDVGADEVEDEFENADGWQRTGLARFEDHGLSFLPGGLPAYFYSERRGNVPPAELVCHTLVVRTDARRLSYCLLLMRRASVDPDELRRVAARYGVEETATALVEYLETRGESRPLDRLPDRDEFCDLARQYGVSV